MANLTYILLATFLSTFAAGAASASDQTGQICIAAWSSTGGDVPSNRWVHQDSTFLITGPNIKGAEIRSGDQQVILETLVRARISVALDGKPMESFRVTLDASREESMHVALLPTRHMANRTIYSRHAWVQLLWHLTIRSGRPSIVASAMCIHYASICPATQLQGSLIRR